MAGTNFHPRHVEDCKKLWAERACDLTNVDNFVNALRHHFGYTYNDTFEVFQAAGAVSDLADFENLMMDLDKLEG